MVSPISSPTNPKVKAALRLRKPAARRDSGSFLIDGWLEIQHAVEAGIELSALFAPPNYVSEAARKKLDFIPVSDAVAEKLSYGQRAAEPVAIAKIPSRKLVELTLGDCPLVLVLDRAEKPGNIGACFRTAEACGAVVVLTDPICELFNPNVIRASRGAIFSLPWAATSAHEFQPFCQEHQLPVHCARVEADKLLWQLDLCGPSCLVFGNEAQGLSGDVWATHPSFTIPMQGQKSVDSLNLSISAAISLYEGLRQRMGVS